ncbi:ATP-binding protein [Butyrivibrio sp. AE3004]|uniref:ATP-binding protein n=1 Tax=Butyrivibrio sp. AE3004 TaxID=1506994 RepID=UPI00068F4567|nr:ATP-binding protein [Butyrivibrio sp. AE3004]
MKRWLIITINLLIMGFILFFIIGYANTKAEESNKNEIIAFEKMTMTTSQIIANYLEDEQHLCDIWANYINRSAENDTPMTTEDAISYIRKAKISPEIEGHLIFLDSPEREGISTTGKVSDPDTYTVSYKKIAIFDNIETEKATKDVVGLTRAYTNPMNGVQSIAFLNNVTVLDKENNELKKGLLMRVVPLSRLEQKLVFLKGEYENVEISLIDKEGNYVVHGKSFKNSNFFEYYKSYNAATAGEYEHVIKEIAGGTGVMTIKNFKKEDCILSYTPLETMTTWFLLAYIPVNDLVASRSIDWLLLGIATLGFLILLMFNSAVMMTYNRKLSEAAKQANQANEAKSNFLSTMSHDIRTPMNAILGLNEMVLRDCRDENIRMYSESIRTAGNTLLGIINDILDFSKIEAGKMEIINVDYYFASLLNDLVNMVQKKAEDKGLSLKLNIDRNIPTVLNGDEIRIKQVIINILSNAVKYTKQGYITFSINSYKPEDKPDSIILKISVEDTGIGIKPEDLDKLFVAFERIEEKRNRNIEGTGLGMTIVQRFLDMMGSHLEVQSEYGKGSVFSFELEQKVVKWDPIGDFEEAFRRSSSERATYHEKFTAPCARVLVVDDTTVNLTVFVNLLKRTGLRIDTAESGDECISLFKNNHYDVIFLDHMMPDKDGIETLTEMKELTNTPNEGTPVICLTANAISGMREMYTNVGFDDYLTKPIDAERLEMMLLQYLPKDKVNTVSDKDDAVDNEKDNREDNTEDNELPGFLYDINELDLDSGLEYCGDAEDYIMALTTYMSSAEKRAEEIENYWKAGDIQNTTIKVHGLKSALRMVGALELGEFAASLEKAGNSGDSEMLDKELFGLLARHRQLAKELEPLNDLQE